MLTKSIFKTSAFKELSMAKTELEIYIDKVDSYRRQCAYDNQFKIAALLHDVLEFLKKLNEE